MPYPNFVILGPPKCGTTSVFDWLINHPNVHASTPKETYFFYNVEDRKHNLIKTYSSQELKKYEDFFKGWNGEKIICEATPDYVYSENALEALRQISPDLKSLFIYRDPVERIYSAFKFSKYKTKRFQGSLKDFTGYKNGIFTGNEVTRSTYQAFLRKWVNSFENKVIIMSFSDLKNDPEAFMTKLCQFLEIDPKPFRDIDLEVRNQTVSIRNRALHTLLLKLREKMPKEIVRLISPLYFKVNALPAPEKSDEELEILKKLEQYFEPIEEEFKKEFHISSIG